MEGEGSSSIRCWTVLLRSDMCSARKNAESRANVAETLTAETQFLLAEIKAYPGVKTLVPPNCHPWSAQPLLFMC